MPQKQNPENFEIAKKESLKGDYSIYKPDPILLVRDNMNLTQMRFFEAYLSKIDASNPETYKVRIYLDTVAKLANIDLSNRKEVNKMCEDIENSRFNFGRYIERYEPEAIDPNIKKDHRYTFPLFDTFRLSETIDGEYFIEVTPGAKMSEMLQKYQRNYATYELQKVYALSTKTNMRMYGCFKKFQKFVTTKISIELFKEYLGIDENKYERTTDLRKFVLEPGIKEINKKTDIFVTYKPYRKGRPIAGWSFTIKSKTQMSDNATGDQPAFDKAAAKREAPNQTSEDEFIEDYNEDEETGELDFWKYDLSKEGQNLTNAQLLEIISLARTSDYIRNLPFHTPLLDREMQTQIYIGLQDKYTIANLKNKNSYYSFLRSAVKENWANIK